MCANPRHPSALRSSRFRLILPGAEPLDPIGVPRNRLPMPFQVQGRFPLDAVVNVRLTRAEKARLREDADLAGLTMSQLVRRRYFGRPIIAHADRVTIRELRRLGGLLKHVHNQSEGAYSQETAAALGALKDYIQKLSNPER